MSSLTSLPTEHFKIGDDQYVDVFIFREQMRDFLDFVSNATGSHLLSFTSTPLLLNLPQPIGMVLFY